MGMNASADMMDTEVQYELLRGMSILCHPTVMMSRSACIDVGGYREEMMYAEDLDLWLRLGELGKLYLLGEVVLRYREHDASVSSINQGRQDLRLAWR